MDNKSVVVIIHSHRMNLLPAPLCFGVEHHCLESIESGFDRLESSVHVLALFDKLLLDSIILEALLILMAFDENHQTRVNIRELPSGGGGD